MTYRQDVLADSPLILFPLTETTGNTVHDVSGNAYSGAITSVQLDQEGVLLTETAALFDGETSAIAISPTTGFPTGHYTVEALIWPDQFATDARVLASWGAGAGDAGDMVSCYVLDNTLVMDWDDGSPLVSSAIPNLNGAVHHAIFRWDGTTRTILCDIVSVASDTPGAGPALLTSEQPIIGADNFGDSFAGELAYVAVYSTALNNTRVGVHYAAFAAEQRPRTVGIYGTTLDADSVPSQLATSYQLLVPGNVQARHTATGTLINSRSKQISVDVDGHWIQQLIPTEDLTPDGCQYQITMGDTVITGPSFAYTTALIPVTDWIDTTVRAGLIKMYLTALEASALAQVGVSYSVFLNADSIWSGGGGAGELLRGGAASAAVQVDTSGNVWWYLPPQADLNPSTGYYGLRTLIGELDFTVPSTYTHDQGDWDVGTAYSTADVARVDGVPYIALRSTTGDDPTTSPDDWALYLGEKITSHITAISPPTSVVVTSDNINPTAGFTPVGGSPYPSPTNLTQVILDIQYASQHTVPAYTWSTKTANYTATSTDRGLLVDATSGNLTITLPTAVGATARYAIKKKDSSANTVTIATSSSQHIDGASSKVISTQNAGYEVYSDGTNWYVAAIPLASGGASFAWSTKTANYTVTTSDSGILADATSGNLTMTLPTAVGFTGIYAVKKKDSSTHTVTVATTSSQTIDGASTRLLSLQDDGIVVVSDGSNWFVWAIPYDAPGYTLPDATTSAIGGVEVDQTPGSGHPIAVTTPRIGAVLGIAPLDTTGKIPSAYIQTLGGSAAEAGRWTRNAGNPVLDATVMADQSCVQEPCVLYDGGEFKMWYRQGATTEAICYATSPDGSTWTKYGSNPVLGQGGSSISGPAAQPSIIKALGTYYCYYTEFGGSGNMRVATSTDGLAWTRHTGNVMSLISGSTSWGNRYVWQEASTWYMLAEANDAGGIWMIYLASSSDGITYTLLNSGNPLTSLRIVSGGCWGGPWMPTPQQIDGLYHLWYHASAVSGNLPSDIYHATSPDKITWTVVGGGPVLTHLGGVTYEFDQVADPHVLEVDGTTYLFYDGDNNVSVTAAIGLATFPGTLHELVSGAALPLTDPTTTEGDLLYRHSGSLARLALGSDLSITSGVLNVTGGGSGELLMEDAVTAPPVPLETEDQSDWLYQG